ncbi:MAG: alpha/beta hydrolase [Planctomycetales bacterium]|jgi:pimeloyl-ACP methyl ester carboxylesterase
MTSHLSLPNAIVSSASRKLQLIFAAVAVTVCGLGTTTAVSQDDAKIKAEGVPGVLTTADRWDIHYTYWESPMGKEAPVIILLHGKGQARLVWKALPLAKELVKKQFAVIAVDLRKHGESKAPESASSQAKSDKLSKFDYVGMVEGDLEAIKKFIYAEHQAQRLNMRKLGVVATDMSTAIALNWAAFDWNKKPFDDAPTAAARTPQGQDVQALVLVSPVDSLSGVGTIRATRFLRATGISTLLLSSKKASSEYRTATKMFSQLGGTQQDPDEKRIFNVGSDFKLSGTNLLAREGRRFMEFAVPSFLTDHVMKHVAPWKDRESRLK